MSVIPKTKDQVDQWRSVMFLYDSALKKLNTKIEILNNEFVNRYDHNPIEHIKSRLKTADSIVKKLKKDGCEVTIDNMMNHLSDIAGIRIICSFVDDIYEVAEMLVRQDDVTVIAIKDYIKNPKPSGYRSLHLILEVPIFLTNEKKMMRVEVQFRTIAMDFWASLEHKLKYKKDIDNAQVISQDLCFCAELISQLDGRMQQIRERLEEKKDNTQSNITGV